MSLSFSSENNKKSFFILMDLGRIVLFSGLIALSFAWYIGALAPKKIEVFCDAEKVKWYKNKLHFISKDTYFAGGALQSNEAAFSGNHSICMQKEDEFGLSFIVPNYNDYKKISASIWRYCPEKKGGQLVYTIKGIGVWKSSKMASEVKENGWEKLTLQYDIPSKAKNKEINIYLWNPSRHTVYFDDFQVSVEQ